jgi:RNA polymerase sigma-70 factor (ECF subfamily)
VTEAEEAGHQAAVAAPAQAVHPELVALYRAHFQFVWRSARRLGVPEAALDDVVQDVFLVVARRLAEFRREASAKTWLFAIALRVVREHRRSTFRHLRRVEAYADAQPPESSDPIARSDATRTLLQLLDQLDDDRRSVYVLAELEGLTAQEIADGLRLNINTVYSRLRAARTQLERALGEKEGK